MSNWTQGLSFTDSTTSTNLPSWVTGSGQSNYNRAQGIAGQPWDPNREQTVAGLNGDQQSGIQMTRDSMGNWVPAVNAAQGNISGLMGYNPNDVTAGMLSGTDIGGYMNPYISNVINASQRINDQNLDRSISDSRVAAAGSGGFGGSRQAITEGVTRAQNALGMGQLTANLYNTGWDNAVNNARFDIGNRLDADKFNVNSGLAGAQFRLGASNDLITSAQNRQAMGNRDIQATMASGLLQQGNEQMQRDARTNNANSRYQDQVDKLNLLLQSLNATPYNTSTHTTGTTSSFGVGGGNQSSDIPTMALGAAMALPGLLGSSGTAAAGGAAATAGSGLLGLASTLSPMLSEDDAKTDIQKVGKQGKLDLYAYRYKGDPKTYPKTVGLMASDVQKKVPKAVKRIGKKGPRTVDYAAALARAG